MIKDDVEAIMRGESFWSIIKKKLQLKKISFSEAIEWMYITIGEISRPLIKFYVFQRIFIGYLLPAQGFQKTIILLMVLIAVLLWRGNGRQ